ncbi:hypothetical protein B566_EDAN011818 [Ephemera danica]|nr:hypothetical protein B566_EDAN011818 [Ephemera danica]
MILIYCYVIFFTFLLKMPEVIINNVPVDFPFEPYEVQKVYMGKVIECLQKGINGVLESPTGTGKTLSLLCASLGWLRVRKAQLQAAATHAQATSAFQGVAESLSNEVVKEQNNTNKIHMCQRYVSARSCMFYNNVEQRKEHPAFTKSGILDIEDLVSAGKKQKCCPYYVAKELKSSADIVFMPYNYLLDPKARKANNIELDNCIVIFDEAHNIEKMCEESASLNFRTTDVTKVMKDLVAHMETSGFSMEGTSAAVKDFSQDDLCIMKTMFLELEKAMDHIEVSGEGTTYPGNFMFDILAKASITPGKRNVIVEIVDKMVQYLTASSTSAFTRQGVGLQKFSELLTVVFNQDHRSLQHSVEACYKGFFVTDIQFMQLLNQQGARCILLTSGTLSPINALISELGIKVPVTLENGHVVTGEQVFVSVVSTGPDGTSLNSSYNTRNDPKYIASLGRTIQNFSRIVPGGLLIFFPSYPVLKKCQEEWQATGIWARIADQKAIFVESQAKEAFANNMADYYEKIHNGNGSGACFLAVCRGKGLSGQQWYQLEASRAVNQAIGRVIRHKNDYGAILLCDTRFNNPNFKQQLSSWLQPHIQSFSSFGSAYKGMARRPEPRGADPSNDNPAHRPAAAAFEQARSRMLYNPRPTAEPALNTSEIKHNILNSSVDSVTGLSPSPLKPRVKRKAGPEDFFSALNQIESTSANSWNDDIDLKMPEFTRGVQSGAGQNVRVNSRKKLMLTQMDSPVSTKPEPGPSKPDGSQKKMVISAYLAKVKETLMGADYQLLLQTVKSYNQESDLQKLLPVLTKLFLKANPKRLDLFQEFSRFLKPQHKEEHRILCGMLKD